MKLEVAKRNNYAYYPKESRTRYEYYKQKYPEAFQIGEIGQEIEDVYWGTEKRNNKTYPFTTGLFNYKRYEGSGKNKRLVSYTDHYFAIKLPRTTNTKFTLTQKTSIFEIFKNRKITTESKKFNDTYKIIHEGEKEDAELEIIRILSPKTQEELIRLYEHIQQRNDKTYGIKKQARGIIIIMHKDSVLFNIPGPLITYTKTKFKKNTKINEEDLNIIEEELKTLIDISSEIVKHIN